MDSRSQQKQEASSIQHKVRNESSLPQCQSCDHPTEDNTLKKVTVECCSTRLETRDSMNSDCPKVLLSYISAIATETPGEDSAHHSGTNHAAAVTFLDSFYGLLFLVP